MYFGYGICASTEAKRPADIYGPLNDGVTSDEGETENAIASHTPKTEKTSLIE